MGGLPATPPAIETIYRLLRLLGFKSSADLNLDGGAIWMCGFTCYASSN